MQTKNTMRKKEGEIKNVDDYIGEYDRVTQI